MFATVKSSKTEKMIVMVPCLNEEKNVAKTVEAIFSHAPKLPVEVEVLMIDDGSTDGTRAEMIRLTEKYPKAKMRINEKNLGLGRSVLDAYETFDPNVWVTAMPGDNEIDFRSISSFLAVREKYDIVLGYVHNPVVRTVVRRVASQAFVSVTRFLYGFKWAYLNGIHLTRAWAYQGHHLISGGHAFAAELLAKTILRHPGIRIGEAPFVLRGRSSGNSKAFSPGSIFRAMNEVYRGYQSVGEMRIQVASLPEEDEASATLPESSASGEKH